MDLRQLDAHGLRRLSSPRDLDPDPTPRWLLLSPHDDDAVLGAGLLLNHAVRAGIAVAIAVVSDGRLGFGDDAEAADLVATRRAEMAACAAALGVSEVIHLGFPDGELGRELRAGFSVDGDLVGLLPALCACYRRFRPTTIFAPTPADLHPDHQAVSTAADIVGFHASAGIWHRLGQPLTAPPQRLDYAVYCPHPTLPDVRLHGDAIAAEARRAGIAAFASQPAIIASLLARLDAGGAVECFRRRPWPAYEVRAYDSLFGVSA